MISEKDFFANPGSVSLDSGSFQWSAPSNIALVKYWGKRENTNSSNAISSEQIPANPSVSFTLNNCKTITKLAFAKKEKIVLIDINKASQEDLIKIYGIGEAISLRILKQKESLGGFVSMEQMNDVWGLSPEVVENLNAHFKVLVLPNLKKIDINNASLKELSQFPYFKYPLAKQIVTFRSMNGDIKNVEDLIKIKGFPVEKANIIGLYLDF